MESGSASADVEPSTGRDAENDLPAPANSPNLLEEEGGTHTAQERACLKMSLSRPEQRPQGPPWPAHRAGGGRAAIVTAGSPLRPAPCRNAELGPRRGHCRPAAAVGAAHQASLSAKHKALPGSPENAAAQRSPTHLRPRVSHFSDGLTDSTTAPAVPAAAAAAVAAVPAAAAAAATTSLPAQHRFAPP